MRYFFDFEFLEDGKTVEPISLGIAPEVGDSLYIEFDFDEARVLAHPWLKENVVPLLSWHKEKRMTREQAKEEVLKLIPPPDTPELWAYFSSYDWIALCQLFGTMMNLPAHFPMHCLDLQQWWYQLGKPSIKPPKPTNAEHNALADALWNQEFYKNLRVYEADRHYAETMGVL